MDELFKLLGELENEPDQQQRRMLVVAIIDIAKMVGGEEWMRRAVGEIEYEIAIKNKAKEILELVEAWTSQ